MTKHRIVVDASGGDLGIAPNVEAALAALDQWDHVEIVLAGPEEKVRAELARLNGNPSDRLMFLDAPEVVTMNDSAIAPLRSKKNSSIRKGIELVKEGGGEAFISAGHTGACMATSKVILGMVEGVDRPAIAANFPTRKGVALVLDVGANLDCKAHHLRQFAVMGSIYYATVFGVANPKVGLLSIGEENHKGNTLNQEVHEVLKNTPLNFVGNVEGRDLFQGDVDVLVCDGLMGNIILKMSESLGEAITQYFRDAFAKSRIARLGYLLSKNVFLDFKKRLDYSEYGGAPLLGVHGMVIICHGHSNARAIKNAIRVALECLEKNVDERTRHEIEALTAMENKMAHELPFDATNNDSSKES